jgi:hypothetical protein
MLVTEPVRAPATAEEPLGPVVVPPEGASDSDLLEALVAALVAGVAIEIIIAILARFAGITKKVAWAIVELLSWHWWIRTTAERLAALPRDETPSTVVLHQQALHNAYRRAAYIVNATRRMAPAVASGDPNAIAVAEQREHQFQKAHEDAERQRDDAAASVAEAVAGRTRDKNGEVLLGWLSRLTVRTCPTCRKCHRRNFNALVRPPYGFPGEVHPLCACRARRPWKTTLRVESSAVPAHFH